MKKYNDPKQLAVALLSRSICAVQVAAVLVDDYGVFAWGWNGVGNGWGLHAEQHCFERANRRRLAGATLFVVAQRKRNKKPVTARPCETCLPYTLLCKRVVYRDSRGVWVG